MRISSTDLHAIWSQGHVDHREEGAIVAGHGCGCSCSNLHKIVVTRLAHSGVDDFKSTNTKQQKIGSNMWDFIWGVVNKLENGYTMARMGCSTWGY